MRRPAKRGRPAGLPTMRPNRLGIHVIYGRDEQGNRWEVSTGKRDAVEAKREYDKVIAEKRHLRARGDDLTFTAGFAQWLDAVGPDCVEKSLTKIKGAMWRLGIYNPDGEPLPDGCLGPRRICTIDQEGGEIDDYFDALQDDPLAYMRYRKVGKAATTQSDANILYLQSLVAAFLNWLIDNKRIASDIVPKLAFRKASDRRPDFYTRDQLADILDAAEALCPRRDIGPPARVYLFSLAAYKSQARTDRILNSRFDLIDFEERTWDFTRVYSPPERRSQPDKSHLRGVKPAPFHHIDDELYDVLRWAWEASGKRRDAYVLGSNSSIYKAFKTVLIAAGVVDQEGEPIGTCHTLKHTGITHLLKGDRANGVPALDPLKVSEMSNTSPDTIKSVYSHAMPNDHADITLRSLSTSRRRRDNVAPIAAGRSRLRRSDGR